MNENSRKLKQWEMESIWKSFEWLIKDKLISIDNQARAMQTEMRTMGVPESMIADYLPQQFERLKSKVVEEQEERYTREGEKVNV